MFERAIREPQNFLKHADEDPDETFDFSPHNTALMLFIDIEMLKNLAVTAAPAMRAFHLYAGATFARAAFDAFPQDALDDFAAMAARMTKREFFHRCLALIAKGQADGTIQ